MENREPIVKSIGSKEISAVLALFLANLAISAHQVLANGTMPEPVFQEEVVVGGIFCITALVNSFVRLTGDIIKITGRDVPREQFMDLSARALANAIIRVIPLFPPIAALLGRSLIPSLEFIDPLIPNDPFIPPTPEFPFQPDLNISA